MEQKQPVLINGLPIGHDSSNASLEGSKSKTVDDAARALRIPINLSEINTSVEAKLSEYESEWKVKLPHTLKRWICARGVQGAVFEAQPCNPCLCVPGEKGWGEVYEWQLEKNASDGRHAIKFMDENQGCCFWCV